MRRELTPHVVNKDGVLGTHKGWSASGDNSTLIEKVA